MTTPRAIAEIRPAVREDIADLITRRPLPGPGLSRLGAFLSLNHHGPQTYPPGNAGLPFGPHPHRGFETVTFIVEGELAHRDSAGNESVIRAGGVQWMTAGSGLIHSELAPEDFMRHGGRLEVLQLWVNLPARLKMTPPRYIGTQREHIPTIEQDSGRVRTHVVSGTLLGRTGPVDSLTGVFMSTIEIDAGGRVEQCDLAKRDVFLYVVRGELRVAGVPVRAFALARLTEGDRVVLESNTGAYVIFGHADPIDEPVVSYGPFVMNSEAEIRQALADFRAGRLGPAAQ